MAASAVDAAATPVPDWVWGARLMARRGMARRGRASNGDAPSPIARSGMARNGAALSSVLSAEVDGPDVWVLDTMPPGTDSTPATGEELVDSDAVTVAVVATDSPKP